MKSGLQECLSLSLGQWPSINTPSEHERPQLWVFVELLRKDGLDKGQSVRTLIIKKHWIDVESTPLHDVRTKTKHPVYDDSTILREPKILSSSYESLRKWIESRDRSQREKVCTLEEAVRLIPQKGHVAIGGCHYSRTPMALLWEIIRQRRKGLTFSRSITSTEGDLLLAGGVSQHIVTSWFSPGVTWGVSRVMREFVQSGKARYEEWSHLGIGLRYRAGAMGVPFLPARSMMGSGIADRIPELKTLECPYTGERLALIPALNPDVALIHVHRADAYGNAQIDGLPFMDADIALAANNVILSTERIVSNAQIRRSPDRTFISFLCVDAVVETPFGSMPHECYGLYEPAFDHMDEYVKGTADSGTEGALTYLQRFCYSADSWEDYLERIGVKSLLAASRAGSEVSHA